MVAYPNISYAILPCTPTTRSASRTYKLTRLGTGRRGLSEIRQALPFPQGDPEREPDGERHHEQGNPQKRLLCRRQHSLYCRGRMWVSSSTRLYVSSSEESVGTTHPSNRRLPESAG